MVRKMRFEVTLNSSNMPATYLNFFKVCDAHRQMRPDAAFHLIFTIRQMEARLELSASTDA